MKKKLIVTERQLALITKEINETNSNVRLRNKIQDFLESDYEPSGGVKKIANEFYNTALIKKKLDGELITPEALADYLSKKFDGLKRKDIIDSIEGWFYDDYNRETGLRKKD